MQLLQFTLHLITLCHFIVYNFSLIFSTNMESLQMQTSFTCTILGLFNIYYIANIYEVVCNPP